jgi:hypothetical protein
MAMHPDQHLSIAVPAHSVEAPSMSGGAWLVTAVSAFLLFGCTTAQPVLDTTRRLGPADLFVTQKSDPDGPQLQGPVKLSIHSNRPEKGFTYLYESDNPVLGSKQEGEASDEDDKFDLAGIDAPVLDEFGRRLLQKRIATAVPREDVRGPITRKQLRHLADQDRTDLVFVFRREVHYASNARFPGLIWNPIGFALSFFKKTDKFTIMVRNEGLLYDRKHNRVYVVHVDPLQEELASTVWSATSGSGKRKLRDMARDGLAQLLDKVESTLTGLVHLTSPPFTPS